MRLAVEKKNQRGFQAAFYLSIGTFWKKKFWKVSAFFLEYFRIICGNSAEKVWPASRNCIPRIYRKFVQNLLEDKRNFFIIFRHCARSFRPLVYFLWGLLELYSTCLREHFREKNVFQSLHFSNDFGQQTNFFRNLVGKNSTGLSKTKIAGPKEIFRTFFLLGYSNLFRTLTASLPGFCKENLGVFVKTGFSFSKETFGWTIFFSAKIIICYFRLKIGRKKFS